MAASIRIGRIFGIPIYMHLTFFIILPLFIYVFSAPPTQVTIFGIPLSFTDMHTQLWVKYLFGTAAAIIFFLTVLAHEVAHSYLAQRYGVQIRSITLMIFGGVSSMEDVPRKDGQEWRMAAAGPLTSLLIGLGTLGVWFVLKFVGSPPVYLEGITILLGLMAVYNIFLAGFNLIPAFPMDGGRVLRSLFAERMPFLEATRRAARIGRYFAIAMAIFGIFTFNFFFIIIALFVYIGASEEEQATIVTESLHGIPLSHIMSVNVEVVHPDTTVRQLNDLMLRTKHMGFPVTDRGLVGIVTLTDTHKVPHDKMDQVRVGEIMNRNVVTVAPDIDSAKALQLMMDKRISRLVVVDKGAIVGIVTQKDFLKTVNTVVQTPASKSWGGQFAGQPPPQSPM